MSTKNITRNTFYVGLVAAILSMASSLMLSGGNTVSALCGSLDDAYGRLTTSVTVSADGEYALWVRMKAVNSTNSLRVSIDAVDLCDVSVGSSSVGSDWTWVNTKTDGSKITAALSQGQYSLQFSANTDNVGLDSVLLVQDLACVPVQTGANCQGGQGTEANNALVGNDSDNDGIIDSLDDDDDNDGILDINDSDANGNSILDSEEAGFLNADNSGSITSWIVLSAAAGVSFVLVAFGSYILFYKKKYHVLLIQKLRHKQDTKKLLNTDGRMYAHDKNMIVIEPKFPKHGIFAPIAAIVATLTVFTAFASTDRVVYTLRPELGQLMGGSARIILETNSIDGSYVNFEKASSSPSDPPLPPDPIEGEQGAIRLWPRGTPANDVLFDSATNSDWAWYNDNFVALLTHEAYFRRHAGDFTFPVAAYEDSYAIYNNGKYPNNVDFADYILLDSDGETMCIPWGTYPWPQSAADISDSSWWDIFADQYDSKPDYGLWVDDVNYNQWIATCSTQVRQWPVGWTEATWTNNFADFMEYLRGRFPDRTIIHNTQPGPTNLLTNTNIQRGVAQADYIQWEFGFTDSYIGNGADFREALDWADRAHQLGAGIIAQSTKYDLTNMENNVVGFLMINNGNDAVGDGSNWAWAANDLWEWYDVDLGAALGDAYEVETNLWQRDFTDGSVVMNWTGSTKSVSFGETHTTPDGASSASFSVANGRGLILSK